MSNPSSSHRPAAAELMAHYGRTHVSTAEAAQLLNRADQTLRIWSCKENGPIVPTHIHGRLHWSLAEICSLLNLEALPKI